MEILTTETEIEQSGTWFSSVEQDYIKCVKNAMAWLKSLDEVDPAPPTRNVSSPQVNYNSGDQSVLVNGELINLLSIPKVVIDKFDGNPLEYQAFVATFDEMVENKTSDDQIKLTRLLQYTAGAAKQVIKYCALVGGSDGYSQARAILNSRFGNKHTVSQKIINDLKQGKRVSSGPEF